MWLQDHFPLRQERCVYKVVQIWPGQTVTCLHTISPGHIWTTLYAHHPFLAAIRSWVITLPTPRHCICVFTLRQLGHCKRPVGMYRKVISMWDGVSKQYAVTQVADVGESAETIFQTVHLSHTVAAICDTHLNLRKKDKKQKTVCAWAIV